MKKLFSLLALLAMPNVACAQQVVFAKTNTGVVTPVLANPDGSLVVTGGTGGGGSTATGPAGSPNPAVVSVQGITGAVPLPVTNASLPLPTGASTAANQTTNTNAITATQAAAGSSAGIVQGVQGVANGLPIDTVFRGAANDRGAVVGTTAVTIAAANLTRRGIVIQVQSGTASCYFNTLAAATADYHSLQVAANAYYETPTHFVGTGAISMICTAAATPVFVREF